MPSTTFTDTTDLSFPLKLYHIMEQEAQVFKWNLGHDSFRIIDEDELVNRILSQHFRTNRFSSFTRNLNIYGFKKIAKGEFAGSYCHPEFKKGGYAAVSGMRRCVRKSVDGEATVKTEPKAARKPTANSSNNNTSKRSKPAAASQHDTMTATVKVELQDCAKKACHMMDDYSRMSIGTDDASNFWDEEFDMEHELALPASPHNSEFEGYPNFYTGKAACCSTPTGDLMDTPLPEDDDLSEWKKVLCFSSNNCPAYGASRQEQPQQPASNGANAYCVQVPAGPLGATLECQGDKVFLSKVEDRNSPLAHIPIGAQLVNLDGKDTTQMAVGQVSQLDESTCHRNRMVIFTLTQCWDTALLAMTPTVPQPQRTCDWGAPKSKSMHFDDDDISMDTDTCSDSSPRPGSPSNCSTGWMQCLYEAM